MTNNTSKKSDRYRWMSPHWWRCSPRKYLLAGFTFPLGITKPNKSPRTAIEDISIKSKVSIKYFRVFFFKLFFP
jgi:hypothetical protein